MTADFRPRTIHWIGLFLISLANLAFEVTLTRIFSVTMWYHFAFMAISVALLGSGAAGLFVYLGRRYFAPLQTPTRLVLLASGYAGSIPLCFWLYLQVPFSVAKARDIFTTQQGLELAAIYLVMTVPFFMAGACLALALTTWTEESGRLYFADLTGAAVGCLASVALLDSLGGAGALLVTAVIASLAAFIFAWGATGARWRILAGASMLLTALLVASQSQTSWFAISVNKSGGAEPIRVFERWNAFSRVTVYTPDEWPKPFGWALSPLYQKKDPGHALVLIDAIAGTPIQRFDGDFRSVDFVRYDLPSIVYYIHPPRRVFVIGPGGGRDVLAALAFGAKEVEGAEINPAVIEAVRGPFADYSGHLYERAEVYIAVEDARGWLTRVPEQYDVIQGALIDTWAATPAGAFALSENSLYTVEAFETYFRRLTDDGILTISRWYLPEKPAEMLRLVSVALTGWEKSGANDAAAHVAVIAYPQSTISSEGLAALLIKKSPFTPDEVQALKTYAERLGFEPLYLPEHSLQNPISQFITRKNRSAFIARYPLDITPATDDRPFFFNLVLLGDLLDPELQNSSVYQTSMESLYILLTLLGVTGACAVLFLLSPLVLQRSRRVPWPHLAYFAALGLGFMLVEVPLVQQMALYLGHPILSLALILFSLLFAGGIGSRLSQRLRLADVSNGLARRLTLVFLLLVAYAVGLSSILEKTLVVPLQMRAVIVLLLVTPLGLLMGMPFPLGLRRSVETTASSSVAWFWALNGATSVLGSVLAVMLAIHLGFRFTLMLGAVMYAGALGLHLLSMRFPTREITTG